MLHSIKQSELIHAYGGVWHVVAALKIEATRIIIIMMPRAVKTVAVEG